MLTLLLACSDKGLSVYNTAPTVSIVSPGDGAAGNPGDLVEFYGIARDQQDDPEEVTVLWSSSIDGDLDDTPPDSNGDLWFATSYLTSGIHTITLSAFDTAGEAGSAAISYEVAPGANTEGAPTVVLLGPTEGQVFAASDSINLIAAVTDPQDAEETIACELIDLPDGSIWTGTPTNTGSLTVPMAPTVGTHTVTLNATDADGNVGTASVSFEVADDGRPTATILQPADLSTWSTTDTIVFRGTVSDNETDTEALGIEWSSSILGVFSTAPADSSGAAAAPAALPAGVHTVTFTTIDGDGQTGSDSIVVTVIDPLDRDDDGDGASENEGDCDDTDVSVFPAAGEACDDVDNDCDGDINEDWWDTYEGNDTQWGYSLGEVDSSFLWSGSTLTLSALTLHEVADEDWFYWSADDEIYDNVSIQVTATGFPSNGNYVLELYSRDTGQVEDTADGSASLTVSYDGELFDEDEDEWAVRLRAQNWPTGTCSTTFTLTISS